VARTFALIAPVHPILYRVSCSSETIPNAAKHYERLQNMSFGSNGVDQVRLLGKITTWLRGTNFCINCTSSVCFAPSFMQLRNDPKCTQILQNILKHYFRAQWGWIGCVHCEKSWCDFGAQTFALIAPIHPVLHQVSCSNIPNAPKHYETHKKHEFRVQLGWIRCVSCEKLQRDFVARTFALIGPVQYVLQQVSCSYGTIPNARKYYKTDRNISLGSNGVDWVHSLRKILTWLCGTNFCINCSSSSRFAPTFMQLRNDPKCRQTLWNTPKMSLGSNGVDWVRSLRKILKWLRGTNFGINCTSSPRFSPSFMQLWNDPKCTQTLWNASKHEFRVQWGGLGAFVAKNPDVTSWHGLLY